MYRPVAALAAGLLLAGCATSPTGGTASPAPATPAAADGATAAPSTGGTPVIDCSFLTPAQVKTLIGASPQGREQSVPSGDGGGCTWEDQETYKSVTIEVGATDTAPSGALPAWDPALGPERTIPGGMRDINGAVQFVCGGTRLSQVQVATVGDADGDRAKALVLIEKIRAKVG